MTRMALAAALATAIALTGCATPQRQDAPADSGAAAAAEGLPEYTRAPGVITQEDLQESADPLAAWFDQTDVEQISVVSTLDGAEQPALFAPPAEPGGALLVEVHSWSDDYTQEYGIPPAQWAAQVGWGFLHPDFRGRNDNPDATGSELAVRDVVDAVDYAIETAGVDPDRVYVMGFSGGGMMSLLLAGHYGDRFAGAVSWVPIHDLAQWYAYNRDEQPDRAYAGEIEASCGGDPTVAGPAAESCAARSPSSVLGEAADAGIPVYIGAGIGDDIVPASHALQSFNALAAEADRLPPEAVEAARSARVPEEAAHSEVDTFFTDAEPEVLWARTSGPVTLALFDGGHDYVFYPGLNWLARLDANR